MKRDMEFSIETRDDYLEARLSWPADLRIYRKFLNTILDHPAWTPEMPVLQDQTELDTGVLTVNDVRTIADLCVARKTEAGPAKPALLVARDLEYGMNRM